MYIINAYNIQGIVLSTHRWGNSQPRGVKQFYPRPLSPEQDQQASNGEPTPFPPCTAKNEKWITDLFRYLFGGLNLKQLPKQAATASGHDTGHDTVRVGVGPQGRWEPPFQDWPACSHQGRLSWGVGVSAAVGRIPRAQRVSCVHCWETGQFHTSLWEYL